MSNCRSMVIFQESFDAREFLDRIDSADVDDHFDMPEYQSKLIVNNFTEPSILTPHAVIVYDLHKHSNILNAFKPLILAIEEKI